MKDKDIAIAFSSSGDTITWKYNEDVRITVTFGDSPVYEYRQGRMYVPGSKLNSYKNSWPLAILPPKHRYLCGQLTSYYEKWYSKHPGPDCVNTENTFCPQCSQRAADHKVFLWLINRPGVPRILLKPHFLKGRTVSPAV